MGQELSVNSPPMRIGNKEVRMVKKLAEGGFAFVYLVEDVRTGEQYALKRCVAAERQQEELILAEIDIMRRLTATNNPHIVAFLGHIVKQVQGAKEYFILLEFCSGGSLIGKLQAIMDSGKRTDERFILQVFEGALRGLAELHNMSPPVAHRDIKIENILLDSRGVPKLCDFGSCSSRSGVLTASSEMSAEQDRIAKHCTEMYRAPELCDLYRAKRAGWALGPKVDIWAMGGVLYTLSCFRHPFEEGGVLGILSGRVEMPPLRGYTKYVGYAISQCFTMDPAQRPSVDALLQLCQAWRAFLKDGKHVDAALGHQVDTLVPGVITAASSNAPTSSTTSGITGGRATPPVPTRHLSNPSSASSAAVGGGVRPAVPARSGSYTVPTTTASTAAIATGMGGGMSSRCRAPSLDNTFAVDWSDDEASHASTTAPASVTATGTPTPAVPRRGQNSRQPAQPLSLATALGPRAATAAATTTGTTQGGVRNGKAPLDAWEALTGALPASGTANADSNSNAAHGSSQAPTALHFDVAAAVDINDFDFDFDAAPVSTPSSAITPSVTTTAPATATVAAASLARAPSVSSTHSGLDGWANDNTADTHTPLPILSPPALSQTGSNASGNLSGSVSSRGTPSRRGQAARAAALPQDMSLQPSAPSRAPSQPMTPASGRCDPPSPPLSPSRITTDAAAVSSANAAARARLAQRQSAYASVDVAALHRPRAAPTQRPVHADVDLFALMGADHTQKTAQVHTHTPTGTVSSPAPQDDDPLAFFSSVSTPALPSAASANSAPNNNNAFTHSASTPAFGVSGNASGNKPSLFDQLAGDSGAPKAQQPDFLSGFF